MKKIIAALALALASTTANAVTYEFDYKITSSTAPFGPTMSIGDTGHAWVQVIEMSEAQGQKCANCYFETYSGSGLSLSITPDNKKWGIASPAIVTVQNVPSSAVTYDNMFWRNTSIGLAVDLDGYSNSISDTALSVTNLLSIVAHPVLQNDELGTIDISGYHGVLSNARVFTLTPVPEPGEWAMMIAGLAIVGATARRRRKS